MTGTSLLNPHPPDFERFLYATVGQDRNGYAVTVLSTLARLGLDPWNETAELVALGREAAARASGFCFRGSLTFPHSGVIIDE